MFSPFTVMAEIKDEPLRIIPLLENFEGIAKVIVLLDAEDTQTEAILKERSVAFIRRPADYSKLTQPERTAWFLAQSPTKFVLIAYASFYVPAKLLRVFDQVAREGIYDAVIHSTNIWSHDELVQEPWIRRRSSACYFFNKDKVHYECAEMHNEFPVDKRNSLKVQADREYSIHVFRDDDMVVLSLKHKNYAEREASEMLEASTRVTTSTLIWLPVKAFLVGYLRMGGFRSGIPGLIYHLHYAWYRFLVYSRLWELQNNKCFQDNRISHVALRRSLISKDRR